LPAESRADVVLNVRRRSTYRADSARTAFKYSDVDIDPR